MGKIILILILLLISVLGTVLIGVHTGNLNPLAGHWRTAFVIGIFICLLLLSATIILALQKPKTDEQPIPNNKLIDRKKQAEGK